MVGITINGGTSSVDSELTMYMEKAAVTIVDALKGLVTTPLNPVPELINTIFYASGLYLAHNNLPDNQTRPWYM